MRRNFFHGFFPLAAIYLSHIKARGNGEDKQMEKLFKRLMAWLVNLLGCWMENLAVSAARPPVQVSSGFRMPARMAAPPAGQARAAMKTIGRHMRLMINRALYPGLGP